jgi:hypothetical protein
VVVVVAVGVVVVVVGVVVVVVVVVVGVVVVVVVVGMIGGSIINPRVIMIRGCIGKRHMETGSFETNDASEWNVREACFHIFERIGQ